LGDIIFVVLLVMAIVLNPVSWWQYRKVLHSITSARRLITFFALVASSVALVFPFVFAFCLPLQRVIGLDHLLIGVFVLDAFSSVASFFGPRAVRWPLLVSSVATAAVLAMVPIGIL